MRRLFITLALAVLAQGTTAAQDKTAVMATMHHFVDAFNKGDAKTATAACAVQTSIIDEFPPHAWHGPGACAKWMADFEADAQKNGITESVVTLGSPRHVEITTDRAYVVAPADFTYKQRGEGREGDGLGVYGCPRKQRGRLAYRRVGMGSELGMSGPHVRMGVS